MSIMTTIMMGKREMELPAIHSTNMFSGSCFQGPSAMDQPSWRGRGWERERESGRERERGRGEREEGRKEVERGVGGVEIQAGSCRHRALPIHTLATIP